MFSAYHRLWNPEFSQEKNEEIFQECFRGHGHNYVLEVTIQGEVDPHTGMVMDIKRLKKFLMKEIHTLVDHKNLNSDVEFLKDIIPTAENMCTSLWKIISEKLKEAKLYRLKLFESENNIVEYFGN